MEVVTEAGEAIYPREVFVGDVRIAGRVLNADGAPLEGARVICAPLGFDAALCWKVPNLGSVSGPDGHFTLEDMPRSRSYTLSAVHAGGITEASHDVAMDRREILGVTLTLGSVCYQAIQFCDSGGRAVDVSGWYLPGPPFVPFWATWFRDAHPREAEALRGMGVELPTESSVLAEFYSSVPVSNGPSLGTRRFAIPGFLDVDVEVAVRPLAEWPATKQVTLHIDPIAGSLVYYRVLFPDIHPPDEWLAEGGSLESLSLLVTRELPLPDAEVTPSSNRFACRKGVRFKLTPRYLPPKSRTEVAYRLESRGEETIVRPEIPAMGFVTLRYRVTEEIPSEQFAFIVDGHSDHRPRLIWPGYARVGPLPTGRHKVSKWRGRRGPPAAEDLLEFEVLEGHRELSWP